jgi:hypothetical protein
MNSQIENINKPIWLSIVSDEMLRDTMKAFIIDLKAANVLGYTSYATAKRVYLSIEVDPLKPIDQLLNSWCAYHPIRQINKPKNISDYDIVDW